MNRRGHAYLAVSAGTYIPNCAIMMPVAVIRITVDLPAMFAPVSNMMPDASPPSFTSFGMKSSFKHSAGCRNALKSTNASSDSTNSGRQEGSPIAREAFARLNRQSSLWTRPSMSCPYISLQ